MTQTRISKLLSWGILSIFSSLAHGADVTDVVTTRYGELTGITSAVDERVTVFRGIPYAAPPTGELRWQPPVPPAAWTETRAAAEFGASCMQKSQGMTGFRKRLYRGMGVPEDQWPDAIVSQQSEDCLYLNIWRKPDAEQQPVMVWIHGGAHQNGSGAANWYEGSRLALRDVVVVTFNYRLNVFGYFAHPALSEASQNNTSGNYGLLDQIAALRWIKENISAFGGDPDNVTIFGESAGGASVLQLMASPLAKDLFHQAISQSGTLSQMSHAQKSGPNWVESMESRGLRMMATLELEKQTLDALHALDAEQIRQAAAQFDFEPTVDGWSLPQPVAQIFADGKQHAVPLMIGSNANEGSILYWGAPHVDMPPLKTAQAYQQQVKQLFGDSADAILQYYPVADDSELPTIGREMLGDSLFGAPARFAAAHMEKVGKPAYLYYFSRVPPGRAASLLGAYHAAEIPFVFDTHEPTFEISDNDGKLTGIMGLYWTNFAKTGDPNLVALPKWAAYDSTTAQHLSFSNSSVKMQPIEKADVYTLFDQTMMRKLARFPE